jgi:putative sigma-54 modulation protein
MNISITFRHMEASEAIKSYARDKVAKLQKFLRQPMKAKVTLSLNKLRHVAETQISSGGEHLEAKETSDDMYASIDKVIDKLERQIRGNKGAARAKKRRSGATLRGGSKPALVSEPDESPAADTKSRSKAKTPKQVNASRSRVAAGSGKR